jgi:DNA-binding MarR family transcriptional regulator
MAGKSVRRSAAGAPVSAHPVDLKEVTVGKMIKIAYAAVHREHEVFVRKVGLTVPQWQALMVLHHRPGITTSDLVGQLGVEAPSVTSLVNGMERKGWVTRTKSAEDARVRLLSLTPGGRKLIEGMREATVSIEKRISSVLTGRDRATLKRLLRAVTEAMR